MAKPTNMWTRYDATNAVREDLSNEIHNISPSETPVFSMLPRVEARQTYHEWQTDSLAAAADNFQIEGDTAVITAPAATARVGNRTQIFSKTPGVSRTANKVDLAGQSTAMAYQKMKMGKEMKLDIERALYGVNVAQVTGNNTTARKIGSLGTWLTSNVSRGAGGSSGATGTSTATDGTQRAFTSTLLNAVQQSCYTNGGNPKYMLMGPVQKLAFSDFDGIATPRHEVSDRKVYFTAEVYVGPFGEMKVLLSRFIRQTSSVDREVYLIDPEYLKIAVLDDFGSEPLGKDSDGYKELMTFEATLEVCNQAAHGIVADLS